MTFPPIRRADPVSTVVLSGEDDEEAAREHLDLMAAAAGREWVKKERTTVGTDGVRRDWKQPEEKIAATGGEAA